MALVSKQDGEKEFVGGQIKVLETLARPDRIYSGWPPWALITSSVKASLELDPVQLQSGISDHGPVSVSVAARAPKPKSSQPVSKAVYPHPRFRGMHDQLVQAANLSSLGTIPRWELHKGMLTEVGRLTRNEMQELDPWAPDNAKMSMMASARAVMTNDLGLAKMQLSRSQAAQNHLLASPRTLGQSGSWPLRRSWRSLTVL